MAPSPIIPTSFVPKQPVKSAERFTKSGTNTFMVLAMFILIVMVVGSGVVFGYDQYLKSVEQKKAAQLAVAEESINADAVETFVRARDRFSAAGQVLDGHIALSRFFDLLESITLTNVRYDSFDFTLLPDGVGEISLSGSARSFNALAAQSAAFSSEKLIKRAIFSGIQVSEAGTVGFSLDAELDPRLVEFVVDEAAVPQVPVTAPAVVPVTSTTSAPRSASTSPNATTTTP